MRRTIVIALFMTLAGAASAQREAPVTITPKGLRQRVFGVPHPESVRQAFAAACKVGCTNQIYGRDESHDFHLREVATREARTLPIHSVIALAKRARFRTNANK